MKIASLAALVCLIVSPIAPAQQITIDAPYVDPYEGMWTPVGEPGSGLVIDQQDDTLVVTVFTYREDGTPAWYLASGSIEQGVFETRAFQYRDGACLNCPWQSASVGGDGVPIRLEVVNRTNAWLTWNDGDRIPVQMFRFGLPYEQIWADDPPFGSTLTPDLSGRWLFVSEDPDLDFFQDILFGSRFVADPGGTGWFAAQGEDFRGAISCFDYSLWNEDRATNCTLEDYGSEPIVELAAAHWADVSPLKIAMHEGGPVNLSENGVRGERRIHAFRLNGPERVVEDPDTGELSDVIASIPYLDKGMWTVPGEPGSGIMFDWQGDTLVYVIFTYDENGEPVWYQGSGLLKDRVVANQAFRFTGGTCLNCEYAETQEPEEPVPVRFEFHSKTTANMRFDGGESMPIRALAFDAPVYRTFKKEGEFGAPGLYDLRGEWLFVNAMGSHRYVQRMTFAEPFRGQGDNGEVLGWRSADQHMLFICEAGDLPAYPQCRLFDTSGESAEHRFSAHWADVGEDHIIGYLGPPRTGRGGRNRGPNLIYGFRLSGPDRDVP